MMEPPKRINPAADFPVKFQCGCEVVFLGSVHHRGQRVTRCSSCGRSEEKLIEDAQRQYMLARMGQPAV